MKKTVNSNTGTVYPCLDARTPMAGSDLLPVKLTINIKGKQFRVGLKLRATKDLFAKAMTSSGAVPKEAKELKVNIDSYLKKAREIFDQFPNADKTMFTRLFKSEANLVANDKTALEPLFMSKIDELTKEDRAGSISFYQQALSSFKAYTKDFYLEDITPEWLKAFRAWWINRGNANATAQIHMRCLRHIYRRAIKQGYIAVGHYPFGEYTIGSAVRSKTVLYPEQLKMLWEYQPVRRGEERSKDFFFFLYLCNGLNIKDALNLKGTNIKGNMISFVRAKTSRTATESKEITMYLHPEVKRIIEKWGSLDTKDYLFPCFRGSKSDIERKHLKAIFARSLNRDLRMIGEKLRFEFYLTMNLARHSFATRLKLDGTPTSFISDALGHSNSKTTEHYLKSIPDDKYRTISESLLSF